MPARQLIHIASGPKNSITSHETRAASNAAGRYKPCGALVVPLEWVIAFGGSKSSATSWSITRIASLTLFGSYSQICALLLPATPVGSSIHVLTVVFLTYVFGLGASLQFLMETSTGPGNW